MSRNVWKECRTAFCVAAFVGVALADNPISNYHYLADPACTATDSMFYILTDSDDPAGSDGYTIKSLYAFGSRDMKNWTDYGIIFEAKREYDNINDIWASGIAVKNGKFYIVYPDGGGGGVGLVGSENINGPYTNPIPGNKKLINNWGGGLADCDGIAWCFDPAIFFDDDGQGYFTFGGGNNTTRPAADGDNNIFNIYKLNGDLSGFDVNSKTQLKIAGPRAMEASYIHKRNGIYYLSYSTADLRIAYGTSNSPMGPYTYKGIVLDNPNIDGKNINAHNNNHHGIAEFKGKWYAVYHDRRLVQAAEHPASLGVANPEPAYHRSVSIDELTWNGDEMNKLVFTNEGPKQIENFDPYRTYPALTSSKQRNIRSRTDWTRGTPVSHVLTPYASKESWIRVSGVDFGDGAKKFVATAASVASGNKIEVHTGSATGTLAGSCELEQTGSWQSYAENECEVSGLSGVVDEVFLVFKGAADSTMGILEWSFTADASVEIPQAPFGGIAAKIPGKIEAEHFDEGQSKAYKDNEKANQGDADFRTSEGVDIVLGGSGMAVGYTIAGEWMEYTVNVEKAGTYALSIFAASGSESSSAVFFVDDIAVTDTVKFPKTDSTWNVYKTVDAGTIDLVAGEHVLKVLITGSYVNLDFFELTDIASTEIPSGLHFSGNSAETLFDVFDLNGNRVMGIRSRADKVLDGVRHGLARSGVYLIRGRTNGFVKKIRIVE